MASTQKHPEDERQSARPPWGTFFTVIGLILVVSSMLSFVLAQVNDDSDYLLEAIYQALVGMGAIAFGESRAARSSSDED